MQLNISDAIKAGAAVVQGTLEGQIAAEQANQQRAAVEYQRAATSAREDEQSEQERYRTALTGLQYADETARPGLFEQISGQYSGQPTFDERIFRGLSKGAQRTVYPQGPPRFLPRGGQANGPGGGAATGPTAPMPATPPTQDLLSAFNRPNAPQAAPGQAPPGIASGAGGASPPPPGQGTPDLGALMGGAAAVGVNRPNPNLPILPQVEANRQRFADEGSPAAAPRPGQTPIGTADIPAGGGPAPHVTIPIGTADIPASGAGAAPPPPAPPAAAAAPAAPEPTYRDAYTGQVVKASPAGGKLQADITYAERAVDRAREFVQNYPEDGPNAAEVGRIWQQLAGLGPLSTRAKIDQAMALTAALSHYEPSQSIEAQRLRASGATRELKEDPRLTERRRYLEGEVKRVQTLIDGSVLPPEDGRWQHAEAFRNAVGGPFTSPEEIQSAESALRAFRPYERAFGPGARMLKAANDKKAAAVQHRADRLAEQKERSNDRDLQREGLAGSRRESLELRMATADPKTEYGRKLIKVLAPKLGLPVPSDADLISTKSEDAKEREEIQRLGQKKAYLAGKFKALGVSESTLADKGVMKGLLAIPDPYGKRYRDAVKLYPELKAARDQYEARVNARLQHLRGGSPPLSPAAIQKLTTDEIFDLLKQKAAGAH